MYNSRFSQQLWWHTKSRVLVHTYYITFYNGPRLSFIFPRYLSSVCTVFTFRILSTIIITVTRYTMSSFIACATVLRATQCCHLLKVRCTKCSTLSFFSIIFSQRTYSVCRITYSTLDTQQLSSASVPTSQKTLYRNLRDRGVTSMVAMATEL
jgi:hypothetical protein